MQRRLLTKDVIAFLLLTMVGASAFSVSRASNCGWSCHVRRTKRGTVLHGKARKGKLSNLVDAEVAIRKTSSTQKNVVGRKRIGSKKSASSETISPALAEWASSSSQETGLKVSQTPPSKDQDDEGDGTEISFEPFVTDDKEVNNNKKKSSKSSKKPSLRQQVATLRDEKAKVLVSQIKETLESNAKQTDITAILKLIKELITLPSTTEQCRTVIAGSKEKNNYRLAWVGSDDGVSHIGTGLHKVPLARLQEVFLELPGRSQLQLSEVIRIIGPFPNVKNTLQGSCALTKTFDDGEYEVVEWSITWENMTDGTGKELLAGKQEHIRKVVLNLYFCSPEVIIAVVPPNNKENDSDRLKGGVFENFGSNILLFIKEENLELSLEKLRVA